MNSLSRILQARFDLIRDEPFFGVPLMELEPVEDAAIPAMATDGTSLFYNPAWADGVTERKLRTVLAHEVMHCGLLHHVRMGQRDLETWNRATDYAVNGLLEKYNQETAAKRGFAPFDLSDGLLEARFDGLSAEEIYNILYTSQKPQPQPQQQPDPNQSGQSGQSGPNPPPSNQPSDPDQQGQGGQSPTPECGEGAVTQAPAAADPTEAQEEEGRWRVIIDHAEKAARMRGHMPAGVARGIKADLNPELPWQEILRQFLRDMAKDDFSWRKPSTAGIANGMLLPGLRSPRMGELVVAIDTSGSVTGKLLQSFLSEVAAIHAELRPSKLVVMDCDSRIHNVAEFGPDECFEFTPSGGGGTRFEPVFEHVEEHDINPVALIYFTDLEGSFPYDAPHYPVLWLDYANYTTPPWGEHIPVK